MKTTQQNERATETALPNYGEMLAEKIRATTTDYSKITDFDKFILDEGWQYKTEETLRAGYDRAWKCAHGITLSEEEFIAEAGERYDLETLKEVYSVLSDMVQAKRIAPSEIYRYASYKWCLRSPDAIVAYQEGRERWIVNNCETEITTDRAIIEVNREWGFEASKIEIIGTPYYDATDWQYIRFNCAHKRENSSLVNV